MVKTTFSTALRIGRVTALALGVAVMLAFTVGVASAAFGANGDDWKLGENNVATAITTLAGAAGVDGPMLRLINNDADANDTALDLRVQPGEAPMTVNSSASVANLNADQVDGKSASQFLANNIYKAESSLSQGTALGDGTHVKAQACNPGDRLLSGGPANISPTTDLLESFPTPGNINSWSARINNNGQADSFSVVVLCADQ